jgi:hypothetical protein
MSALHGARALAAETKALRPLCVSRAEWEREGGRRREGAK